MIPLGGGRGRTCLRPESMESSTIRPSQVDFVPSRAARGGFATATDLADYLVRSGVAFRDAHDIVGRTVNYAIEQNKDLDELALEELQQFHQRIQQDVFEVLTLEGSVSARSHIGGTAPEQVRAAVARARVLYSPD